MALSRSIRDLLKLAEEITAIDDDALDALGRRLLEAVVADPDALEDIREQAARMLCNTGTSLSASASRTEDTQD